MITLRLVESKKNQSVLGFKEIKLLEQRIYYTSEFIKDDRKCTAYNYEWLVIADGDVMVITEDDLTPEIARGVYVTSKEYYKHVDVED